MPDSRRPEIRAVDGNGYVETDPSGRYGRFDDVLGKGAMKTVYRAFDEQLGVEVAWNQAKLCDVMRSPEALQRLCSEVNLLSDFTHESIIRFHTSWIDPGKRTFNFITEMFTSGTLREYRQRYRQVDIQAVKNWARQILHGLVYLHGHNPPVIHRDLKCDNIFVNGHLGQVKIGDLGLAAVLQGAQCAHSVIGTPEFMAPELYEEDYNELVDIYSFGLCVLEMLTVEYPYSECSNPAQIYKKVTSGKLPEAFYRVQDPEARRFIGRCLEKAHKRSSAKDLLLDPFLDEPQHPLEIPAVQNVKVKGNTVVPKSEVRSYKPEDSNHRHPKPADMTITGKMNEEDDTIFLKVQIADREGNTKNIYFPFDTVTDTPIDVANEMVRELDITDREPSEIAEMIEEEIANLVPDWKEYERRHAYNYGDECDHPFCSVSSPTSSQSSAFGLSPWRRQGEVCNADWLPGVNGPYGNDDDDETSSMHSGKYSNWNYISGNEYENDHPFLSKIEAQPTLAKNRKSILAAQSLATRGRVQYIMPSNASREGKKAVDGRRLMRNRSMVDLRSQLLHRRLVEELNKRLFKTVGAVENIGFGIPVGGCSRHQGSSAKGGS